MELGLAERHQQAGGDQTTGDHSPPPASRRGPSSRRLCDGARDRSRAFGLCGRDGSGGMDQNPLENTTSLFAGHFASPSSPKRASAALLILLLGSSCKTSWCQARTSSSNCMRSRASAIRW
jgi:hypothetical protein